MADNVILESPARVVDGQAVSDVSPVQAKQPGDAGAPAPEISAVADVSESTYPGLEDRPCWRIFEKRVETAEGSLRPGVWYFGLKHRGDKPPVLIDAWVCSPLHVQAVTSDAYGNNFGRLLRFRTTLGQWREWAMPMELLRGNADELRGELLSMGLEIDAAERGKLGAYLQCQTPRRRMTCALEVGWADKSFVLPDCVIGPAASNIIFQSAERAVAEYVRKGSFDGWQEGIARLAVGNPVLALALSMAFAGPLLSLCHAEGGGVHLVGDSSSGKTTALNAACSVWGGTEYKRSWRATANGIEGAATLFNDNLLALDEISEADPREIGVIAYALTNGVGKQRATKTGAARTPRRWRCVILSSGERTLETSMLEGGMRPKAGQQVRLLDLPIRRRHGAWDELHGQSDGRAFSDALKAAAATHCGHAGRLFLNRLTMDDRDFGARLEEIKTQPAFSPAGAEGQERRAAARFALIALAGELATEYGVTGWPPGTATDAAAGAYGWWRDARGKGNDERRKVIEQLCAFVDAHGSSRFEDVAPRHGSDKMIVRYRAGWRKQADNGMIYYFTATGMREALKGFDFGAALDLLQAEGIIDQPGANGERAKTMRFESRSVKVYEVASKRLPT